jgi:hypothetical protein
MTDPGIISLHLLQTLRKRFLNCKVLSQFNEFVNLVQKSLVQTRQHLDMLIVWLWSVPTAYDLRPCKYDFKAFLIPKAILSRALMWS